MVVLVVLKLSVLPTLYRSLIYFLALALQVGPFVLARLTLTAIIQVALIFALTH